MKVIKIPPSLFFAVAGGKLIAPSLGYHTNLYCDAILQSCSSNVSKDLTTVPELFTALEIAVKLKKKLSPFLDSLL